MTILLIDNYDSYTWNLFQLLARVDGAEPVVIPNDAPAPDLGLFDGIVISPGPGRPDRVHDIGICAEVLARATAPTLGVCLGHQAIAAGEGGTVGPAPRARHGHVSRIRHDGTGLFAGLPQGFDAVRYHSLAVAEPLPPTLVGCAWAEDGVLMGLAHRSRPLWGVQFHPESVAGAFGDELVAAFCARTRRRHRRPVVPRPVAPPPITHRLHVRRLPPVDAEAAFLELYGDARDAFWLDSALPVAGFARFSFLGDGSGPLAETVTHRRVDGDLAVLLERLRTRLIERAVTADLPFDFCGGWVGWFGYELGAPAAPEVQDSADVPDAWWLFADRIVVVDHEEPGGWLVCLSDGTPAVERSAAAWLERTAAALADLPTPAAPVAGTGAGAPFDRERFLAGVDACRRELLAGESYEICLTAEVTVPAPDGLDLYRSLRRANPAPYAAYLRADGVQVACSSPERFLRVDRDRRAETRPIKGTAARAADPAEDDRRRTALAADPKTVAENLMIVDLARNDLGRVCAVGTVEVPDFLRVESYATVHQLLSVVRGRLRDGADALDAVAACFPGGSMTGAPKRRTMEIIERLESRARGVYSGSIGWLGVTGTADLGIVIRTAVIAGGRATVGAGAAIVLDSDPVAEWEETLLKADAVLRAFPGVQEKV